MSNTQLKIGDPVHYIESRPDWATQLHWHGTVTYLEGNNSDPIAHIQWEKAQQQSKAFSMQSSFRASLFCPSFND